MQKNTLQQLCTFKEKLQKYSQGKQKDKDGTH